MAVAAGHLVGRLNLERDQLQLDTCGLALNQSINPWTVFNQPTCLTNIIILYSVAREMAIYGWTRTYHIPIQIFTAHALEINSYCIHAYILAPFQKKKELPGALSAHVNWRMHKHCTARPLFFCVGGPIGMSYRLYIALIIIFCN